MGPVPSPNPKTNLHSQKIPLVTLSKTPSQNKPRSH